MTEEKQFELVRRGQDVFTESSTEFVLPDYKGDVRKILYTEATLRPESKFVGEDEVEFSGQVAYKVMYLDSENRITGADFYSDYDVSAKKKSENVEDATSDCHISNFAVRLLGPRKFSAKASITSEIKYNERMKIEPRMWDKAGEDEIQTKKVNARMRNSKSTASLEREFAESLTHLDGMMEDEVTVLYSSAAPLVESASAIGDQILIKGRLNLRAVIETDNSPAYMIEKNIPFEFEIENTEEMDGEAKIFPEVRSVSERFMITPDETGVDIVANVILEYTAVIESNSSVELLSDAFITVCPTENTYFNLNYTEIPDRATQSVKHTSELRRDELCEGALREIVFVNATAKTESCLLEDKRLLIKGEVRYVGVTSELNDDGSVSYSGLKHTDNFAEYVNINCQNPDKTRFEVKINTEEASAELDAEKVYLSCGVHFDILALEEKEISCVVECIGAERERFVRDKATVRVYYPDADEDVFTVARKFHTSLSKLCKDNSLSVETAMTDCEKLPKKLMIL